MPINIEVLQCDETHLNTCREQFPGYPESHWTTLASHAYFLATDSVARDFATKAIVTFANNAQPPTWDQMPSLWAARPSLAMQHHTSNLASIEAHEKLAEEQIAAALNQLRSESQSNMASTGANFQTLWDRLVAVEASDAAKSVEIAKLRDQDKAYAAQMAQLNTQQGQTAVAVSGAEQAFQNVRRQLHHAQRDCAA